MRRNAYEVAHFALNLLVLPFLVHVFAYSYWWGLDADDGVAVVFYGVPIAFALGIWAAAFGGGRMKVLNLVALVLSIAACGLISGAYEDRGLFLIVLYVVPTAVGMGIGLLIAFILRRGN